jgi:hypothetical protein
MGTDLYKFVMAKKLLGKLENDTVIVILDVPITVKLSCETVKNIIKTGKKWIDCHAPGRFKILSRSHTLA